MRPVERLRAASPVPRDRSGHRRPTLDAVVPGLQRAAAAPTTASPHRRGRPAVLAAAACLAVTIVALVAVPRLLEPAAPLADSAYYESFEQLESASANLVAATVMTDARVVVGGNDMVSYTVSVAAVTGDGREGQIDVLVPAVADGIEPTAEAEPLQVGQEYVLALSPLGDRWQLTSPADQSAFLVHGDQVGASLDGSLTVSPAAAEALGLR